jgi:3-methylcrotonyl-CoA carboxylase alpha subunit
MKLKWAGDPREFDVEIVARDGRVLRARIDGVEIAAEAERCTDGSAIISAGDRRVRVAAARRRNSIYVAAGPAHYEFVLIEGHGRHGGRGPAAPEITAPMPGKVLKVLVAEGDTVEHGQALVVLEAMKMETTLYAESAAVVKKIRAAAGDTVDHGAVLIELGPAATSSASEAPAQGG